MTSRQRSQAADRNQNSIPFAANEQAFRLLFENHPIPMLVYDLKTLELLRVNEAAAEIYGYSRDEFKKLNLKDIITEAGVARLLGEMKKKQPAPQRSEWHSHLKDGRIIEAEVTSHILDFEGHKSVLVMVQGKQEQENPSVSVSETELRALFASMRDAVMVIDRNGVYRKIAPTNPDLLIKPPQELLGKSLLDMFSAEQAEIFLAAIHQVLETKQSLRIEYQLPINERSLWFATSISPMDVDNTLWVASDITKRKQSEISLRELMSVIAVCSTA